MTRATRTRAHALVAVDALRRGATLSLRIASTSMSPLLPVGALVRVLAANDARPGDIVALASVDGVVVHRVVAIDEATVLTRGDARTCDDARVARADVIGVVTHVRRFGVWLPAPSGVRVGRVARAINAARRSVALVRRRA